MKWFNNHYFGKKEDTNHPYASLILYNDMSGLLPVTILTAQYDPLRDSGKAYADALEANGVKVTYKNYDDPIHRFSNFTGFPSEAKVALLEGARSLRESFER